MLTVGVYGLTEDVEELTADVDELTADVAVFIGDNIILVYIAIFIPNFNINITLICFHTQLIYKYIKSYY